jgi:hypothetical protein
MRTFAPTSARVIQGKNVGCCIYLGNFRCRSIIRSDHPGQGKLHVPAIAGVGMRRLKYADPSGSFSIRARVPAIADSIEVPAALRPELGLTR